MASSRQLRLISEIIQFQHQLGKYQLGISVKDAEGRIVAEILRNSDQQTADASGGKHDYEVRSILGCQNLNCDGYKTDPYYADHNYNSQYIAQNQAAYDLGQAKIGTDLTYGGLVASNYDKDPVGNTVARAGTSLLVGSVAGGMAAAWGIGTAFTYVGDAISGLAHSIGHIPDQHGRYCTCACGATWSVSGIDVQPFHCWRNFHVERSKGRAEACKR